MVKKYDVNVDKCLFSCKEGSTPNQYCMTCSDKMTQNNTITQNLKSIIEHKSKLIVAVTVPRFAQDMKWYSC